MANVQTSLALKDSQLAKGKEELHVLTAKMQENARKQKDEYDGRIKELEARNMLEKENAKKGIRELAQTSKREEEYFTHAILEIKNVISQVFRTKRKGTTSAAATKVLAMLDGFQKKDDAPLSPLTPHSHSHSQSQSQSQSQAQLQHGT